MHGSYESLKYGTVLDGLADLTGGVAESIPIKNEATGGGRKLSELLDMTSIVTANIQSEKNDNQEKVILLSNFSNVFSCRVHPGLPCELIRNGNKENIVFKDGIGVKG